MGHVLLTSVNLVQKGHLQIEPFSLADHGAISAQRVSVRVISEEIHVDDKLTPKKLIKKGCIFDSFGEIEIRNKLHLGPRKGSLPYQKRNYLRKLNMFRYKTRAHNFKVQIKILLFS